MEFSSAALMTYEDKRALPSPPASPLPFPCTLPASQPAGMTVHRPLPCFLSSLLRFAGL